jgi:hypothetical protein
MDERERWEFLDVFLGQWILEASIASPGVTGRAVFGWALGPTFLMERSEAPRSR